MSDRLHDLFDRAAPPAAPPAATSAALEAARPGFAAARVARLRATLGGVVIAATVIAGTVLAVTGDMDRADDSVAAPMDIQTYATPGGEVTAQLAGGELSVIEERPTPGYDIAVLQEALDMLTVAFTGPDEHVLVLAVEGEMIVEADDDRGRTDPPGQSIAPGQGNENPSEGEPPGHSIAPGQDNDASEGDNTREDDDTDSGDGDEDRDPPGQSIAPGQGNENPSEGDPPGRSIAPGQGTENPGNGNDPGDSDGDDDADDTLEDDGDADD